MTVDTGDMNNRAPFYIKVIQGVVEQVYDHDGYCISQQFLPMESADVDRRIVMPETVEIGDGELEDDEIIEHPEDIEAILQIEKHCDFEMMQPPPPPK